MISSLIYKQATELRQRKPRSIRLALRSGNRRWSFCVAFGRGAVTPPVGCCPFSAGAFVSPDLVGGGVLGAGDLAASLGFSGAFGVDFALSLESAFLEAASSLALRWATISLTALR